MGLPSTQNHTSDHPVTPNRRLPTVTHLNHVSAFSILASNPNLKQLALSHAVLPNDTDASTLEVPLRNLKLLSLEGGFRHIFGLLRRLILPATLDSMELFVLDYTAEDISQTLRPYMRDYFRRDVRFFQDGLVVSSFFCSGLEITVDTVSTLPATLVPRHTRRS